MRHLLLLFYHLLSESLPFSWEPAPFHIDGPLGSLYIILCGATIVLQGEVTRLSSQFFARPRMSNNVWNLYNFSKHFVRLMGSLFMVLGFSLLIWKPLKFPDPTVSNDQQTSVAMLMALVFLGIFLCIGSISWFLALREKRRVEQKELCG